LRALLYTDLQASESTARLRQAPEIPLQRWRVQKFYADLFVLAEEYDVDAIWDLGDTTDDRTSIAHETVQLVSRGSEALTRGLKRPLCFKLLGNHEQAHRHTVTHAGDIFQPYFNVIDDRAVIHVPPDNAIILASFPKDHAELATWIRAQAKRCRAAGKYVVVLAHVLVAGSRLGSGATRDGMSLDTFLDADRVILGHVHKFQELDDRVCYLGSPFQQDLGEALDPPKRVAIFDTSTCEIMYLTMPGFPVYRTVSVNEMDNLGNDVVRVIIGNKDEAARFYAHPNSATVDAVYSFSQAEVSDITENAAIATRESLIEAWAVSHPMSGVAPGDLLMAGLELAGLDK
jgi:hypothetical protein